MDNGELYWYTMVTLVQQFGVLFLVEKLIFLNFSGLAPIAMILSFHVKLLLKNKFTR
ncbi:MAG: hypothetical protein XD54_0968 [Thermococcus sibiricus]|uniref:Uncharacterized protein n=1 Tax=Thermococcus sibiricus TaxID=172049 RepID=A0A101ELX3_9EURY|nr:MAG: hypothetical protein XD54_0968 [Thermococcus sibiricus]KUK27989.1 MAG: hypothetical protein XD61_1466 [Thermococcus sp. 40_45]